MPPEDEFRAIVAGLRALTAAARPVFVMHGNRDFLLGAASSRPPAAG